MRGEEALKKQKEGYSVFNNLRYLLGGIWASDRRLMLLMVIESACMVTTPYIAMYLPKVGVVLVMSHAQVYKALLLVGGLGAGMALS